MSGPVSSAVVSEAVSRITSFLSGKYSEHKNMHEWIHRLEMARIKIKSAVQESEAFDIDIDGALHEWQEKLKVAVCEAEEALSNFQAKSLHEKPNPTVEGGSSARDQLMQEEGHDNATLGLPGSNLREAVPRQVELEPNIPHDPFMQEEGSDDATQVSPALNLREAITHQVNLEANLPHDPFMHEEESDDATLVNPASNLREAITRQVNVEANLTHDSFMQDEGSDDATLVHPASNLKEAITHQVNLEANLPHDPFMLEEGSDDATLVHPASNLREAVPREVDLEEDLSNVEWMGIDEYNAISHWWKICVRIKMKLTFQTFRVNLPTFPLLAELGFFRIALVLNPRIKLFGVYLENHERVRKLIKTVEKLEKAAGDIGDFIELLKLQSKRNMCRKRKRSGVALQGFLLVISLKLQIYALFCYGEDPYLLVIMLFHANFNLPTGITGYIFIGYIM